MNIHMIYWNFNIVKEFESENSTIEKNMNL